MASKFAHASGEAFLQCPFNPDHRITNPNFQSHLAICRKRFRKSEAKAGRKCEMLVCKFNPSHRFLEPELKWHEDICPDGQAVLCCSNHHNCKALQILGLDGTNENGKGESVEEPAGLVAKKKSDRENCKIGSNAPNNLPPFTDDPAEAAACQFGCDHKPTEVYTKPNLDTKAGPQTFQPSLASLSSFIDSSSVQQPSNVIGGDSGMNTESTNVRKLMEWPWKDDPSDFHPDDTDDFEGYDQYQKN